MKNVVFMGIQGSGKGTQAGLLKKRFNYFHLNSGEEFRRHIVEKTDLGILIADLIRRGDFVADKYVNEIVDSKLAGVQQSIVMDGFPRNIIQAKYLLKKYKIHQIFLLELDEDIALQRLNDRRYCTACHADYNTKTKLPKIEGICDFCGKKIQMREDDNPNGIKLRLERFKERTLPAIEYYKGKNLIIEIDASQSPEEIHKEIISEIGL